MMGRCHGLKFAKKASVIALVFLSRLTYNQCLPVPMLYSVLNANQRPNDINTMADNPEIHISAADSLVNKNMGITSKDANIIHSFR